MSKFVLPVVIEKDSDGYFAYCPSLQGCYSQGDRYEEALANIEDAMRLYIEDRLAKGESIPRKSSCNCCDEAYVEGHEQ